MTIHFTCSICGKTSSMDLKSMADFFHRLQGSSLCHLGQHEAPGGQIEHLSYIYTTPNSFGFHPCVNSPQEGYLLANGVPLHLKIKENVIRSITSDNDIQELLDPEIRDYIERQLALGGISWD